MNDLFHRLRWTNIARAAAVLAALGLVLAWPHLHGGAPALPPATAASPPALDTTPAEPDTTTLPEAGPSPPARRHTTVRKKTTAPARARRRTHRPSRGHARRHAQPNPPATHTDATSTPTSTAAPPYTGAYAVPAPALQPEFRP
jgi:hypothetical protein